MSDKLTDEQHALLMRMALCRDRTSMSHEFLCKLWPDPSNQPTERIDELRIMADLLESEGKP